MIRPATTLSQALIFQAHTVPNNVFMHHKDKAYTYKQTNEMVDRFVTYLEKANVVAGDNISIMLPRTPELVIAFLAATKIGARPAPVNYLSPPSSIIECLLDISPKVLISSDTILSTQPTITPTLVDKMICVDIENKKKNCVNWEDTQLNIPSTTQYEVSIKDVAYLNYTTGTSGKPKGALATHENIYWNTRSLTKLFSLIKEDVHLCMFASFAHPHEIFARALYTGASIVLLQEISPKTIIRTINTFSVTCIMGLAPMYDAMASHCSSMKIESVRIAESGGMYTRPELNEIFKKTFNLPILSVWGSTETSGATLANDLKNYRTDGSMGRICPFYQVKLLKNGSEVGPGETGELFFRGPGVISGYENYPPLCDSNGWYPSGDLAKMDKDGYYYFIERKSGMIKYAGLKIYPLQVENALLEHPDIIEAAIIGIPNRRKGTVPKAIIVVRIETTLKKSDIHEFCKGRLPSYMIPKEISFWESLPKIGSGKINKKEILTLINQRN